jgi:Protein of unknown function (DUF1153)
MLPASLPKCGTVGAGSRRVLVLRWINSFLSLALTRRRQIRLRWSSNRSRKGQRQDMTETQRQNVARILGFDGNPLTMADLPTPGTRRWVIRRKAAVVAAVRGGLLSLEEARGRYILTAEEFFAWQDSIDHFGLAGLRITKIQKHRRRRKAR